MINAKYAKCIFKKKKYVPGWKKRATLSLHSGTMRGGGGGAAKVSERIFNCIAFVGSAALTTKVQESERLSVLS